MPRRDRARSRTRDGAARDRDGDGIAGDWRSQAACAGMGGDLFVPDEDDPDAEGRTRLAKAVCADCPVLMRCLRAAMSLDVEGVWGGLTRPERNRLRRRIRAGRAAPVESRPA